MKIDNKTRVYIDGANLYRGSKSLDWVFDYKKFYIWLSENFKTENESKSIKVVSPSKKLSYLIRRLYCEITYLNSLRRMVEKKKRPLSGN